MAAIFAVILAGALTTLSPRLSPRARMALIVGVIAFVNWCLMYLRAALRLPRDPHADWGRVRRAHGRVALGSVGAGRSERHVAPAAAAPGRRAAVAGRHSLADAVPPPVVPPHLARHWPGRDDSARVAFSRDECGTRRPPAGAGARRGPGGASARRPGQGGRGGRAQPAGPRAPRRSRPAPDRAQDEAPAVTARARPAGGRHRRVRDHLRRSPARRAELRARAPPAADRRGGARPGAKGAVRAAHRHPRGDDHRRARCDSAPPALDGAGRLPGVPGGADQRAQACPCDTPGARDAARRGRGRGVADRRRERFRAAPRRTRLGRRPAPGPREHAGARRLHRRRARGAIGARQGDERAAARTLRAGAGRQT